MAVELKIASVDRLSVEHDSPGRDAAVVITGASTGIGRAVALYLDRLGHRVFAGVRRTVDAEALQAKASKRLTAVRLDVANERSIAAAAEYVATQTGDHIQGLVNNAATFASGPLELIPISEVRQVMEVNVVGVFAVTQAFLPMLRRGRGRIVNVSSAAGLNAPPGLSPYAASKFALGALTDSLRVEVAPFGIPVSIVFPGLTDTAFIDKGIEYAAYKLSELREQAPGELSDAYAVYFEGASARFARSRGQSPDVVAAAIAHALAARRPKRRYVVGRDARAVALLHKLPGRLRDWLITRLMDQQAQRALMPRQASARDGLTEPTQSAGS
jgi:NAD(P)-dependent dehydrogenase (short-subunit alcohol dehydrogenase family)